MSAAKQFMSLEPSRRARVFEQAATERGIGATIMEKDFWVCWVLHALFSQPVLAGHLVFKGGTSLSKVYDAIDRFSEDVDLSLSPEFAGANLPGLDALSSRGARAGALKRMQKGCGDKAREEIAPLLERIATADLGVRGDREPWFSYEFDEAAGSPNLYFHYPTNRDAGLAYVRPTVKLELGSLTDQQPVGRHAIRPWVAEALPALFTDWQCDVTALDLARSFWEKATIIHGEYHRAADSPIPDRYARHYSDVARLAVHPQAATFLADRDLCARVAEWKDRWFARTWARYDLARHGTFRLVPPAERYAELDADYSIMRPMFLSAPPPFSEVIQTLRDAEDEINRM